MQKTVFAAENWLFSFSTSVFATYIAAFDVGTVKKPIKEQVFWGFRLILFLYVECFLQNQPENVLKVFLKLLL